MELLKGTSLLDRSFKATITLKGIDGLLEILGGFLVLWVSPARLNTFVTAIALHTLSKDPHDFLANHLLLASRSFTGATQLFAFLYLVSHGLAKAVLVIALWLNRLWAYPAMIVLLGLFIAYQLYRMTFAPSLWLIVLTLFDALVIWLTWEEYKKQRHLRRGQAGG